MKPHRCCNQQISYYKSVKLLLSVGFCWVCIAAVPYISLGTDEDDNACQFKGASSWWQVMAWTFSRNSIAFMNEVLTCRLACTDQESRWHAWRRTESQTPFCRVYQNAHSSTSHCHYVAQALRTRTKQGFLICHNWQLLNSHQTQCFSPISFTRSRGKSCIDSMRNQRKLRE